MIILHFPILNTVPIGKTKTKIPNFVFFLVGLPVHSARLGSFAWAILNICNHLPFDTRIHLPIPCLGGVDDENWLRGGIFPVLSRGKLKQFKKNKFVVSVFGVLGLTQDFQTIWEGTLLTLVWHVEVLKHENKMCVLCFCCLTLEVAPDWSRLKFFVCHLGIESHRNRWLR